MNNLQTFSNSEFGTIRTIEENGQIWFVGKDVAEALGYTNPRDALTKHVHSDDKRLLLKSQIVTLEIQKSQNVTLEIPNRGMTIINESGLYALIFGSKLESAKRFKHWVTSEVLPTIRRTGTYGIAEVSQRELTKDDYIRAASMVASCRNERLPYVLGFLEQGGFKIPNVEQMISQEKDFVDVELLSDLLNSTTMTLREISQLTNISKTSLSYYKNCKNKPSPERYAILIQVLN